MRMRPAPLPSMPWRLLRAALCLWLAWAVPAGAAGLVTIVDGEARLIEGAHALLAAEGLKVADQTLVRTGARARLLRVEWPDGSVADFGPDTQAMLVPPLAGARHKPPAVYLLRGWVKLASLGGAPVAGLLAPQLELLPFKGAAVVLAAANETWVFAESGSVPLEERGIRPASVVQLGDGQAYRRDAPGKGNASARPAPAELQRVPEGFRSALPLRAPALAGRAVSARPAPPPGYDELRDWLLAEPGLRRTMPRRFAERARDPAFRAALLEHLRLHADWEAVLFPERFAGPAASASR